MTPLGALQVAAVQACVRVLAETVALLPLNLYRRRADGGKDRLDNDPLHRLIHDQPNSLQTAFEFRELLMTWLALRGNAYAEIKTSGRNEPLELMPQHPDRVRVMRLSNGRLRYFFRDESSAVERSLEQEEVLHIRGISDEGVLGLSPIGLARNAVGLASATERHGSKLFAQGAQPGGVLQHPGHFKDAETGRKVAKSFDDACSGAAAHRTVVLEEGMVWNRMGMSSEDAQFLETRQYQAVEIARIFRVPPHLIGDLTRATFSNIEHQGIEFVTYTICPWLSRWEQAISRDLLAEAGPDVFAEFNVDGLLRGDAKARNEAYATAITNGWMSRNEVRARENLNPEDGLDEYLVPMNMTVVGGVEPEPEPAPAPPPPAPPAPGPPEPDEGEALDLGPLIDDAAVRLANAEIRELEKRAHHAAADRERFNEWVNKFYTETHQPYMAATLTPLLRVAGMDDRAAGSLLARLVSTARIMLVQQDPVGVLEDWKVGRADWLGSVIRAAITEDDDDA